MKNKNKQAGVTMMELMIVVAIAAILAAIALPAFDNFVKNTKQSSTVSQLVSDLGRAKSEAIKRNTRTLLCVRNTAGTDCGTSSNWANGWLICYTNAAGSCDTTSPNGNNPVVVHGALDSNLSVTGPTNPVQFRPNGTAGAAATLTLTGSWNGVMTKTVSVSVTGNISSQ